MHNGNHHHNHVSDHRMVRSCMRLTFKGSKHRCGTKPRKKLDVAGIKSVDIQRQLENKMDDVIKKQTETALNVDESWTKLRDTVYQGALDVLGTTKRKHRDWFDENDAEAATILRKMHESHLQWINDRESAAKADTYRHHQQSAQARLRVMKEQWWSDRATELQEAADRKKRKAFLWRPQSDTRSTSKWFFLNIECRCRNTTDRTQSYTGTVGRTLQRCAKPVIHNLTGLDRQHSTATADGRTSAAPLTWWNYCSNQETFQWKSSRTRCDCCRNVQVRWNKPHKEPCKAIQQYPGYLQNERWQKHLW